jgi:hypothetical protein
MSILWFSDIFLLFPNYFLFPPVKGPLHENSHKPEVITLNHLNGISVVIVLDFSSFVKLLLDVSLGGMCFFSFKCKSFWEAYDNKRK